MKTNYYPFRIKDRRVWRRFRQATLKNNTTMLDVLWQAVLDYLK